MKKFFKNEKGSVLAFTIMVFAVLMILGTFTLSFMVTENTQSIHHNDKAQAYYYARSGVESVEKALVNRLSSFGNDAEQQSSFVERFDEAREIDLDLEYITEPVIVKNETINEKKVITVTSTVTYRDVTQTVKKAIYSTSSMISSQGFIPGHSEFFIYLGDEAPLEIANKTRNVPSEFAVKVPDEEKDMYKASPFSVFDWNDERFEGENSNPSDYTVDSSVQEVFINGDLEFTQGMQFEGNVVFYVKGSLYIDGTVEFNKKTDIYVRDSVSFGNNLDLKGSKSNGINQLRIFSYNSMTNTSYNTTSNSGKFRMQADLYVNSGSINLGFPQNSQIDGHIIYNGNQNVNIKTNSNSYADKLITGSIYAPFGTVNLGIISNQVAIVLGGQVIGDRINVYPNNKTQGNKFYNNSTAGRITNNPIPIDISAGIDTNSIRYESFFFD